MKKTTTALSGASQDAYFRRVLKEHPNVPAEERDRIVQRLHEEVAQLRVRRGAPDDPEVRSKSPPMSNPPQESVAIPPVASIAPCFDPYSPNVVLVLRKAGREAALQALDAIENVENLRLLAREQRLNVAGDVSSPADMRLAIIFAAERRIANRMAAAG